jgi:hypothetical protein
VPPVRRHLLDLLILLVLFTIAALVVVFAEPGWRDVTVRIYVFALGILAMVGLVAGAGEAMPPARRSRLDAALAEPTRPDPPLSELERLQREVTLARTAAFDLHHRLLPQLRDIAAARLERTGRTPGPDTLGRWWDLLRPDREPPDERFAPGLALAELRALLRDLERLSP